jgi:hypothetical protein
MKIKKNSINKLNTNLILKDKIRKKNREKRTSLTIHMKLINKDEIDRKKNLLTRFFA